MPFHVSASRAIALVISFLLTAGLGVLTSPTPSHATSEQISYGPNGDINAILADGTGGAYVGGTFTGWGYQTGGLAAISGEVGAAPDLTFPDVDGTVLAIEPDGEGGFFLGGNFDAVGGEDRVNLAHIDSNGSVTDWAPETDDSVFTLALHDGLVFAGGRFVEVWDETTQSFVDRTLAAAFDAETAELSSWNPGFSLFCASGCWFNLVNEGVWDFHILGSKLYVGGSFNELTWDSPTTPRSGLAAFDLNSLTDGSNGLTAFVPDPDGPILSMATSPGGDLLVGGIFETVGATPVARMSLAEIDVDNSEATTFDVPVTFDDGTTDYPGQVQAIATSGSDILLGGGFDEVDGQPRPNLALVSSAGVVSAWTPAPDDMVDALAVTGGSYYVAGSFSQIDGQSRDGIAKFNSLVFETAWNPDVDDSVSAISVTGGGVLIGGRFNLVGTVPAQQLVRVTSLGTLDDSFEADSSMETGFYDVEVTALAMWSGELAVGRTGLDTITDNRADSLEWLDPSSGAATSRLPFVPNGAIETLVTGARLFVGGSFTSVDPPGGASAEARAYGFGVLADGQTLAAWAPAFTGPVNELLVDGDFVYAVGEGPGTGSYIGSTPFAVRTADLEDGALDNSWSVDFSRGGTAQYGEVFGIATWAGGLAIGGRMLTSTSAFDDGLSLLGVSTVDASITWQGSINGRSSVRVLTPRERSVILGGSGSFNSADTSAGPFSLAILDAPVPPTTRTSWSPEAESRVNAVAISGSNLFVGGRTRLLITPVPVDGTDNGGGGGSSPSSSTATPQSAANSEVPKLHLPDTSLVLKPGEVAIVRDGQRIPALGTATAGNSALIVTGGEYRMSVPSPGGLGGAGAPTWKPGASFALSISGFQTGTSVSAYLLSTPQLVGSTVPTNATGTLIVSVPREFPSGSHTLQVVGQSTLGQSLIMAVGVTVAQKPQSVGTKIYFPLGSAELTKSAKATLRSVARQVKADTTEKALATIVGAVRAQGATKADIRLAAARAKATATYLKSLGFSGMANTKTSKTRALGKWSDRRVDITIKF